MLGSLIFICVISNLCHFYYVIPCIYFPFPRIGSSDNEQPTVQHCHVVRPHRRGFGFNAALAVFESIDQLVLRHRFVSLKYYFKDLDASLAFPVGCQSVLRFSLACDESLIGAVDEPDYISNSDIQSTNQSEC